MTVLVAAASKYGATDEIAERIGADLAGLGVDVEVKKLEDVERARPVRSVRCSGAASTWGRGRNGHAASSTRTRPSFLPHPTWLFGSGSIVGHPPVADDPNAVRATLVETLLKSTHARERKLFAGKLDKGKLGLAAKLSVSLARATEGDHRLSA